MNLEKLPLEDGFETTLSQSWDGTVGAINVNATPNFTFPVGVTTYIVINPTNSKLQIAEIDSYDALTKTINVTNITLEKGAGIDSTANSHPVNSKVIISDNYQFWADIRDAINSKLDNDGGNAGNTWDLEIGGSSFRIRLDGGDMKFTDDNNVEISLSTIAAAAGADRKVATTNTDTQPGNLEDKLTTGSGIKSTVVNPGANESFNVEVDLDDTNIHATETDFGLSKKAATSEFIEGINDTKFTTPAQTGFHIEPGDTLLASSPLDESTNSSTYIKIKEIEVGYAGNYTIVFNLMNTEYNHFGYGQIYKNGVAFGTERVVNSATFVTYTENLVFGAGDLIQLYMKGSSGVETEYLDVKYTLVPNLLTYSVNS